MKKLISILLILAIVITFIPSNVFAASSVSYTPTKSLKYKDYKMGTSWNTHIYSVSGGKYIGTAIHPNEKGLSAGKATPVKLSNKNALSKILYYGNYQSTKVFPTYKDNYFTTKKKNFGANKKFIIRHLALGLAQNSKTVDKTTFKGTNATAMKEARALYKYAIKQPAPSSKFHVYSLTPKGGKNTIIYGYVK